MFRRRRPETEGPVPNRLRGLATPGQLATPKPAATPEQVSTRGQVATPGRAPTQTQIPTRTQVPMRRRNRLLLVGTVMCAVAIGASIVRPEAGDAAALVIMGVAAVVMIVFGLAGIVDMGRALRTNPLAGVLSIVVGGWHLILLLGIGLLLGLAVLWTIGLRP